MAFQQPPPHVSRLLCSEEREDSWVAGLCLVVSIMAQWAPGPLDRKLPVDQWSVPSPRGFP